MRVEQLSNYGGEQLDASRRTASDARSSTAHAEIAHLEAEAEYARARRSRPILRRVLGLPNAQERAARDAYVAARDQVLAADRAQASAETDVRRRAVGEEGEERLVRALGSLGDRWILFRGYMTKAGEADAVLVGPNGVWVIEVKNRRVLLTVDGDEWYYDTLSRSGRVYERKRAVDGGGRVWGRQAGDAARALGRWLDRNGQGVTIRTAVVLISPDSEVVSCRDPGVDLVTHRLGDLNRAIAWGATAIGADHQAEIERLIRRDHRHSMKRRQEGSKRRR